MAESPLPLQPLDLPLWGSRLIEASAGTGKTWTIAALYLRLVLGHGEAGSAWREPLAPPQILVMTFTRAATQELRERIRQRLALAAACFRDETTAPADDEVLQGLLRQTGDAAARETAAWRLALAADAMDDSAVFTIDAWCQRMLREHALASGSLFDEQVLADDSQLLQGALRDVWRREVYPLQGEELEGVLRVWPDLQAFASELAARVRRRADAALARADGAAGELGAAWRRVQQQRLRELARLRQAWVGDLPTMREWLLDLCAGGSSPFKANMVSAQRVAPWFDLLQQWAQAHDGDEPALEDKAWLRLAAQGLRQALKKGCDADIPDAFERLPQLRERLQALPRAAGELAARACAAVEQRLGELKQQAHSFGFVDLQLRLARALDGADGAQLRQRIREQYPVALIDEFQDTSALQFALFDSLYRLRDNDPQAALLLIGDPKQSIYAFRGADIDSYIRARQATAARHYVLHTNYRSSRLLVDAVNRLFAQAEARAGAGAFGYRDGEGNPLPFVAVAARGLPQQWVGEGGALPVLEVVYGEQPQGARMAREDFAQACAEHIVARLNDPSCGLREGDALQRLRPRDIAVLVRTRVEAQCVRAELQRRGVASVYLSERESVFDSAEAHAVLRWLRAVAQPRDAGLARAALASAALGLSLPELQALADDDRVFERHADLLLELHAIWQRQGVLPMLRTALHRLQLARRWLAAPGGERRLTNVLHLAELLQRASAGVDGEHALVRWLERSLATRSAGSEEQLLRLESESDLVRVVTIHKSKGLEYPLVYLPFAGHFRSADDADDEPAGPTDGPADGSAGGSTGGSIAQADELRLREDLRLLYVALTRARHALWVGVAALRGSDFAGCALGNLLGAAAGAGAQPIGAWLQQALQGLPAVALRAWQPQQRSLLRSPVVAAGELREPPPYRAEFERDWQVASFSALARDLAPVRAGPGPRQQDIDDLGQAAGAARQGDARAPWHAFARGAQAGSFLHQQLAWLAEQGFGDAAQIQRGFALRCARLGWQDATEPAWRWLQQVLHTPLPPLGASLAALREPLAEMEFWFPVEASAVGAIDSLCARRWLAGWPHARLDERRLHGLLMGFADLVFEHQGRYWVLDYKSNALGEDDAHYHHDALAAAVAAQRYDVQAMLYLLALHRLLRSRLGSGYQPRLQLGGAICLFLRGIAGPQRGCLAMPADIDWLERLDRLLQGGDGGAAGGAGGPR